MNNTTIILFQDAIYNAMNELKDLETINSKLNSEYDFIFEGAKSNFALWKERKAENAKKLDTIAIEQATTQEQIKLKNLYIKALKKGLQNEVEHAFLLNLTENRKKIEGAPLHYKKVSDAIKAAAPTNYIAGVSSYYGNITISSTRELKFSIPEICIYCGQSVRGYQSRNSSQSEYDFTFDRIDKIINEYVYTSPAEIAEQFKKYIAACKQLKEARNEYMQKCNDIQNGCSCIGLTFEEFEK